MKQILILCEGQTEETFVNEILNPHLEVHQRWAVPTLVVTKRMPTGQTHRGGITSYAKIRCDVEKLLRGSHASCVTTMIDYYGLPADFPGKDRLQGATPQERVAFLEQAFAANIGDRRFHPFLMLHEFEALLFSAPDILLEQLGLAPARRPLGDIEKYETPEEINDGADTHPAARIARSKPNYRKPLDGLRIAKAIGLDTMRKHCPHFNQWVCHLETC
ncbi:MAG: DUF4276 family protein [Chloroflexus sp.]|nr:DUF4276 family protein [Chloroflexus sp.]